MLELSPELEARLLGALKIMDYEKLYPEQAESIRLNIANKQTLTLLSTGGGKTACYVIPGLVRKRITVVVSPLIALQNDQAKALTERGIPAFLYNSDVSDDERELIARRLAELKEVGQPAFLFVAPESLISEQFMGLFGEGLLDFMAIDEIHCVSTWGNSFRPDYQRLGWVAKRLQITRVGGYTATITESIKADIFRYTSLIKKACRVVTGDWVRPNLHVRVVDDRQFVGSVKQRADQKKSKLLGFTEQARGAVIVYCSSRRGCEALFNHEELGTRLREQGYTPYVYHAEILRAKKREAERGFESDPKPLVFATNAFGMGIDRADVGLVVHYNNPRNLLGYAQEIGRAGRDGKDAECVTFFDLDRLEQMERFHKFQLPSIEFVEQTHRRLGRAYLKWRTKENRAAFSTSKYMRMLERTVQNAEDFDGPDRFMSKTRESMAILRRAGYFTGDGSTSFKMYRLDPGKTRHGKLIELTKMVERSELAQIMAATSFFTARNPDQELLRQLLADI